MDTEGEHGEFEIVHAKTFVPKPKLVIEVVGDNELVIVPEPDTNVQTPFPTTGVLAAIVAIGTLKQTV